MYAKGRDKMIYLDSAATSFYRPPEVAEAVAEAIRTMGNCSRGVYETALTSARVILEARELADELFNGDGPEQTVFTANSTESLNIAIKGVLEPGDRVVTTVLEHNSVLRPLYEMESKGVELVIVGCVPGSRGVLDYESMKRAITSETKAVVCTHGSNLTGNLTDIKAIGSWCRENGALFIVDGSQTAGICPIDMKDNLIDILCFTGHKGIMGPQGTGGMCVRKGITVRPLLSGGSGIMTYSRTHPDVMPTALEAGTLNGHGIAGIKAAFLYIKREGMDNLRLREQGLMRRFLERVRDIPNIRIYGDFSQKERGAIVALNLGDEDSGAVSDYLAQGWGIYTRAGGHCAPLMHEALGTATQGAVRFSFSPFNCEDDVDKAAKALRAY